MSNSKRKEPKPRTKPDPASAGAGAESPRCGASPAVAVHPDDALRLAAIQQALESVADPEIPVVSVVELGIIAGVRLEGETVVVEMTPTFVGCPALDVIRGEIRRALREVGERKVTVEIVYDPPWTTDRITAQGRRKLKEFGLAPPGARCEGGAPDIDLIPCPYCDSHDTELESIFGPTLCRSIHYCRNCLQSFEHFKAV